MIKNPRRLEWINEMNKLPYREAKIIIGKNTVIHGTAILGAEGVGMERNEENAWVHCSQHGDVIIEDSVHIGAYCNVKRATLPETATIIGEGTVLCPYVNVGHNCKIGKYGFIGPHVCLDGSVEIGDGCWIGGHAILRQHIKVGDGAIVGIGAVVVNDVAEGETVVGVPAVPIKFAGNHIHSNFKYGKNLKIGKFNHIYEDVVVGDNCVIRSYVELREGTVFGDDCYIDSGVKSSGQCKIGNRVTLRYDSIIARGVEVEDDVFISPQLMTENINHLGENIGGAKIGVGEWHGDTEYRVFIGTNVTLTAGITICPGTVIGSKTNVRKSIVEPGVYVGNPARKLR